jgi:DNA (cytosine-5)-methyltransferase 1
MREATNGLYPRYAVWENVPGAFSSNRGRDFRAVVNELAGCEVPMPKSGKWGGAGLVRGNGNSLAWRVLDAQYWGVPQRRRRIFLVTDFGGQTAPEILFEPESVCGDITEGRSERESIAQDTQFSITESSVQYRPNVSSGSNEEKKDNMICLNDQGGQQISIDYGVSPTLRAETHGNLPCVLRMRSGCEGGGKGALVSEERSLTLATGNDQTVFQPIVHPKVTGTLCASGAGLSRPAGMGSETDLVVAYSLQGSMIGREIKNGPQGDGANEEVSFTLNTIDRHAVAYSFDSLSSNSMKSSNPESGCRQVDVPRCLDTTYPDPSKNQGGIAIVNKSFLASGKNVTGTLLANCGTKQWLGNQEAFSVDYSIITTPQYAVRRLTPLECERLQGYPDGWTDIPSASDTARYKALGNSVAIPCVQFIMDGIAKQLRKV